MTMQPIVKTFAPAKVNLTLHVTGQRADGYHLLDSLVAFADVGDRLTVTPAGAMALEVGGPMAEGVPADAGNLVWRAAELAGVPVSIYLSKHLPNAAGLGGGSSDAAALLLAIADLTGERVIPEGVADLGADIRICLTRQAARMSGIGERVAPVAGLAPLPALLVNPGVALATPDVFARLAQKDNQPMPKRLPAMKTPAAAITWLAGQRNDLEAPAIEAAPVIGEVLARLAALKGARLARMSGSGATCFALFDEAPAAEAAAQVLAAEEPGWWVQPTRLT